MSKIPTAEEFFKGISEHNDYLSIAKAFAKMHVIEALRTANEKAKNCHVDELIGDEVLYSYDLENIK